MCIKKSDGTERQNISEFLIGVNNGY